MKQQELQAVLDEVNQEMDDLVDIVFLRTQEILVEEGKVDTANLLQTANINREYLSKTITYPASYAEVVNYGRGTNTTPPPIQPILEWVRRNISYKDDADAKSIAYAISKSIGERGIEGIFFVERAVDEGIKIYESRT